MCTEPAFLCNALSPRLSKKSLIFGTGKDAETAPDRTGKERHGIKWNPKGFYSVWKSHRRCKGRAFPHRPLIGYFANPLTACACSKCAQAIVCVSGRFIARPLRQVPPSSICTSLACRLSESDTRRTPGTLFLSCFVRCCQHEAQKDCQWIVWAC